MIKATSILPKRFDPDAFVREGLRELEKLNDQIETDFERTVATWTNRPRFKKSLHVEQGSVWGYVRTVRIYGAKPPELIYYWINNGTRIRFAKMTSDFEPKSRRRVIDSFAGRGGLESLDVKHPYPGIQGREFDVAIATKHNARLKFRIEAAIRRGAKASGHLFK